jgi:polymorphic toxin system nucleotidyltransferase-like protein
VVEDMQPVPPRFLNGYNAVKSLQRYPRYVGAIIFGSVAEGQADNHSDLDVKVVVDEDNSCSNINHPVIDGYKLDISFASIGQLTAHTEGEMKREWGRSPNLATALIVFDKTGELHKLKQRAKKVLPPQYIKKDHQFVQFMLYHANDKVERYLEDDPSSALYSMHANIGEVLKIHYRLNQRWWVSSKRILADLDEWDKPLAKLLRRFVLTSDVEEKYAIWTDIIDHIARLMGGRQPIQENNCDCEVCTRDLKSLLAD